MKINYYTRYFWWNRWVSRQKSSPHKLKNITDYIRSKCLVAILKEVERANYKLPQLNYKLGIKRGEILGAGIDRDEFGKTTVLPEPIYSKKSVASLQTQFWTGLVLLFFFGLADAYIYVMTSSTYMSQSTGIVQIAVGTFFAVTCMFALAKCFSVMKSYLEALDRFTAREITANVLKWYRIKRNYARGVAAAIIAGVFIAGVSRIFFFEYIDPTGMTADEYHSQLLAVKFASLFSLVLTMAAAIYVAFVKQDFSKIAVEYLHYLKWNRTNSVIESNTDEFIKYASNLIMTAEQQAHIYWQHVIDIKGYFQDSEYDAKYDKLHDEYWTLRSQHGFIVNDEIYQKYSVIQSAYEELFIYGIIHDEMIIRRISEAGEMLNVPKEQVSAYIKKIEETRKQHQTPAFSSNGTSKGDVKFNDNAGLNTVVTVVAFLALALLGSCNKMETKPPKNIVAAVDMSGSRNTSVIDWYKDIVSNHVIPNAGVKGRVVVIPIDSGSLQSSQEILYADFSLNNYINKSAGQNQDKVTKRLHGDSVLATQRKFSTAFDSALTNRKALNGGTDISGALESAKIYYLPDHENIITVLSDMLICANYGKGLVDFEHTLNDTAEIEGMLAKVPIVDLRGFKVIVVTGSQNNISTAKYGVVKAFWERWFNACHADLRLYTSGSLSLLDKELTQ